MITLLVMSLDRYSGKTALCLGIARKLVGEGREVGYFKPLTIDLVPSGETNPDGSVMKEALGLEEPIDLLTPVSLDGGSLDTILADKMEDLTERVRDAFSAVSSRKDIMVVEGPNGLSEGTSVGLDNVSLVRMIDAYCLLVVRGASEWAADGILAAKKALGDRLIGVVLNAVPRGLMEFTTGSLTPFLERHNVKVYATLPEDRMLMSATVGEIVEKLGGKVVAGEDRLGELVENVMVGAMSVENALNYFRRRTNKAVITGGDRPDIQLAALETSTRCIILTGNLHPNPLIMGKAEELGVPIVLVQQDTLGAAELVEQVFNEIRFHDEKKIQRFHRMLDSHLDFEALKRDLGL